MARKRTRLHGSPEHHALQSGLNFDLSLGTYKEAKSFADKGKCLMAFRQILAARGAEGEAKAHMREVGTMESFMDSWHGSSVESAGAARTEAWKTFESKCLVGGGLSGMRRRRR